MFVMRDVLEACPFCGSGKVTKNLSIGMKWQVGCNDCGCRTAEYNHSCDAVNAWNKRPEKLQDEDFRSIRDVIEEIQAEHEMMCPAETPF